MNPLILTVSTFKGVAVLKELILVSTGFVPEKNFKRVWWS